MNRKGCSTVHAKFSGFRVNSLTVRILHRNKPVLIVAYRAIDHLRIIPYNPHSKIIYNFEGTEMAKYRIIYWKHIPQSITVEGDGRTIKKQLSDKIQNKIDAYAMAEGLTSTSDYAAQYKRGSWTEQDGTPEEVADA